MLVNELRVEGRSAGGVQLKCRLAQTAHAVERKKEGLRV